MKNLYKWYKFANNLGKLNIPILPQMITYLMRIIFGCYIPHTCKIGEGTKFGYGGLCVVIHGRSEIGKNCLISQGVTLGGTNHNYDVPKIGNNVYVGAGAKIIGPITIGDNVVIGANAVVVSNLPSNTVAVGIPAKIIKKNIQINDYI